PRVLELLRAPRLREGRALAREKRLGKPPDRMHVEKRSVRVEDERRGLERHRRACYRLGKGRVVADANIGASPALPLQHGPYRCSPGTFPIPRSACPFSRRTWSPLPNRSPRRRVSQCSPAAATPWTRASRPPSRSPSWSRRRTASAP